MSVPPIEAEITPPEAEQDGGDDERSVRLSVSLIDLDDVMYDAGVCFPDGVTANDPERFAEALLGCAIALASMRGSDFVWAAMRRFTAYGRGA